MINEIPADSQMVEQKITKSNGEVVLKRYIKGKLLGKGGFAKCYEGYYVEGKLNVAIKVVEKHTLVKNRAKQKLLSEIKIHKTLIHRHIVKFDNVFEDSNNVYMILELCQNRTLSEMIKKRRKLTVYEARFYMLELLSALEYMHQNRVIHRDLKMGNIFLNSNMQIKVGDFGLATKLQFSQEKKRTMCGTPNYIAPEIVEGMSGHSYQVDIWSTGVICYAMLFGRPPFQTKEIKATYKRIKNCQYFFPATGATEQAKSFISKILILDPKERMSIQQMLMHPFLNNENIPKSIPVSALTTTPNFENMGSIVEIDDSQRMRNTALTRFGIDENHSPKKSKSPGSLGSEIILSPKKLSSNIRPEENIMGDYRISVLVFVDYSTKYGLGYMITDKSYGVYFNDSSLMSLDATKSLYYIENPSSKEENILKYSMTQKDSLPSTRNFQKKYLLLEKFLIHLDEEGEKIPNLKGMIQENKNFVYVKQWLKTKHAVMFRLSNKLFQVNFLDKSQILLNTEKKTVFFKSKKGQIIHQTLQKALHQKDTEFSRRIKYTKEILNSIRRERQEDPNNDH